MATSLGSAVLELEVDSKALKKGMASAKSDVQQSMKTMGLAMTVVGAAGVAAFGLAAKAAISYDAQIAKTVGLTSASREEMDKLRQEVLKLAPAVGIGPRELADALYFVISAGIPAAEAMSVLEAAAKASASGLGETMVVADALTSAMNAYKASADEASRYTDILTNIVLQGKTAPEELASSLGKVLPIAAAMGVSFEEVGANIALMTRVGFDAANATTYLRATLNALIKPSEQAKQIMGEVGMSFDDLREIIREKGLLAAFELMMELTDGNIAMLSQLFPNVQAVANVLATAGSQGEAYNEVLASMYESTGLAGDAFAEMEDTTSHKIKSLKASFDALMITLGTELVPVIGDVTSGVQAMLGWIDKVPAPLRKIGVFAGAGGSALLLLNGMLLLAASGAMSLTKNVTGLITTMRGLVVLKTLIPLLLGPVGVVAAFAALGAVLAQQKSLIFDWEQSVRRALDPVPVIGWWMKGPVVVFDEMGERLALLESQYRQNLITVEEFAEQALPILVDGLKAANDKWGESEQLTENQMQSLDKVIKKLTEGGYSYYQIAEAAKAAGLDISESATTMAEVAIREGLEPMRKAWEAHARQIELAEDVRRLEEMAEAYRKMAAASIPEMERVEYSLEEIVSMYGRLESSGDELVAWVKENFPDMAEEVDAFVEAAQGAFDQYRSHLESVMPELDETFDEWAARLQQMAADYNAWEGNLEKVNAALVSNTELSQEEIQTIMGWVIEQGPEYARDFGEYFAHAPAEELAAFAAGMPPIMGRAVDGMIGKFAGGKDNMALAVGLFAREGIVATLENYEPEIQARGARLAWAIQQGFSKATVEAITYLDQDVARMKNSVTAGLQESPEYFTLPLGIGVGEELGEGISEGIEGSTPGVIGSLVSLRDGMLDMAEEAIVGLNAKIAEEERVLDDLEDAIESVTKVQEAWRDEVDRISDSLDEANDRLRRFTDAAIEGTQAFSDAMFRLDMDMDRLKLKINELEQAKLGFDEESSQAEDLDKQIEELEAELSRLRLDAEALQLQERLKFDPLRRQIDKLTDSTEELTFEEIKQGIIDTQDEIEGLTSELAGATSELDKYDSALEVLNQAQEYHSDLLGKAKEKYGELTGALKEIDPELAKIAESMGEGYAESLQNAFKAMEEGNTLAAEEALGVAQQLFDDIEALIQGSGQEQLVQPLGDALAEALGLVDETFGIKLPGAVAGGEAPLRGAMASVLDGVIETLEEKMSWITFWANLTTSEISSGLMNTLHQMVADLAAGNYKSVLAARGALASFIDWLERDGQPGVADVLKDINGLFRDAAADIATAAEGGISDLDQVFRVDLGEDVPKTVADAMLAVTGAVTATGEEEMPKSADATMNALRMGLYGFQSEAGQWGEATMAWVATGMYRYMRGDGRSYARAVGRSFIGGIIEGLDEERGALYSRITQIIEGAIAAANEAAGAASPAKRFMEMGANFARSLEMGWGRPTLDFGVLRGAMAGPVSKTFAPSITVNADSDRPHDIARKVRVVMDDWWREVQLAEPLGV